MTKQVTVNDLSLGQLQTQLNSRKLTCVETKRLKRLIRLIKDEESE